MAEHALKQCDLQSNYIAFLNHRNRNHQIRNRSNGHHTANIITNNLKSKYSQRYYANFSITYTNWRMILSGTTT